MAEYPIIEREDTKNISHLQDSNSKLDLNHFFKTGHLRVDGYEENDEGNLLVYVSSSECHGICPYCETVSHRVHRRYTRQLQDLPAFGKNVIRCFRARKFFCSNNECRFRTFEEQPGNEIFRHRRRTRRCERLLRTPSCTGCPMELRKVM